MRPRLAAADEHSCGPCGGDRGVPRDPRERDEFVEGAAGGVVVAGEVEAPQGVAGGVVVVVVVVVVFGWRGEGERR